MSEADPRTVFYSTNWSSDLSEGFARLSGAVAQAIASRGVKPVSYAGITRAARSSNLDREIRDDFFSAEAVVLVFSEATAGCFPVADHWAIDELRHLRSPCFVYFVGEVSQATKAMLLDDAPTLTLRRLGASDDLAGVVTNDLGRVGLLDDPH